MVCDAIERLFYHIYADVQMGTGASTIRTHRWVAAWGQAMEQMTFDRRLGFAPISDRVPLAVGAACGYNRAREESGG